MAVQRLHSNLAPIDVLTRLDLENTLTTRMDAFIRDWYRGESWQEFNGVGNSGTLTIPGPDSGYTWALKTLSVIPATNTALVSVYLGDNTATAPIGQVTCAAGSPTAIFTWTSNVVVVQDQRNITVTASSGNLGAYKLIAKQVPSEMVGKL